MNDLETHLRETLHATHDLATGGLSGPVLRRAAHRRTVRVRTGGVAAMGAAGAVAVLVAPALISGPTSIRGSVGAKAPASTATADKGSVVEPKITQSAPPSELATATTPVQASVWKPAGSLISDPTILRYAPEATGADGVGLDPSTVSVVYADRVTLDNFGPQYPRPLVIVTGHLTAADPTLQIAELTTPAGGPDSTTLAALAVEAMHPLAKDAPQALAVSGSDSAFVAADGGITAATYTYTDSTGSHTAAMTLEHGVATVLQVEGHTITKVTARSGDTVVWDRAPVQGN